jgi:hypothetical protein
MPRLSAFLIACSVGCALVALRPVATGAVLPAQTAGGSSALDSLASVGGTVTDARGEPVAGADAWVVGTAITARSNVEGKFLLDGIAPGRVEVRVRKLGFQTARASLELAPGTLTTVSVRFATQSEQLDAVNVVAQVFNTLSGTVVDDDARPLAGVRVDVVGTDRSLVTGPDGRFVFFDIAPGAYLLETRAVGRPPKRAAVRMVAQIDRDLTVRLERGDYSRKAFERDAIAVREARTRQSSARPTAAVVGREEFAPLGKAPLSVALRQTSGAIAWSLVPGGQACVVLNGDEPLLPNSAGSAFGAQTGRGYGPATIGYANMNASSLGGAFVDFFQADQVELVEIYPPRTDESRSLCSRFPRESPCGCTEVAASPPMLVVWLRR